MRRVYRELAVELLLRRPLTAKPRWSAPEQATALPNDELKWLAGWLEGEGSFGLRTASPSIHGKCTDRDVVERAAQALGGKVAGPHYPRNPKHKPTWLVKVYGLKAMCSMVELYAEMGERRRAKIRSILDRWEHVGIGNRRAHGTDGRFVGAPA